MNFDVENLPYYNHNPRISKFQWVCLLLSVIVSVVVYGVLFDYPLIAGFLFCSIMLVPLLAFTNWNYSLIFRKPIRGEVLLAFMLFAGYLIYGMVVGSVVEYLSMPTNDLVGSGGVDLEMIVSLLFSMMGEELLKFIPLMFLLRVVFKFTDNLKFSIVLSSLIVMLGFGCLHAQSFQTLLSAILIQGFGSVFELYGYFKTGNLFVPYMSHLFTDALIFILIFLGF